MKRQKWFVYAALAVVLLAMVGSVGAITWGERDTTNRYPMVVGLLFERPDGFYSCTGTLLTPYVVLTAGHCTEEAGQLNIATWVRNVPDIGAAFAAERSAFPAGRAGLRQYLNTLWIRGTAVPHPNYADYATFPNTYDVGLVLLSQPIVLPAGSYGQLPTQGQFNFLNTRRGSPSERMVTSVGYGRQEIVPVSSEALRDAWVRMFATSAIANTRSANTDGFNFMLSENPGSGNGTGGTCFGDSGGPQFWGSSLTIASVTSFGITGQCNGNGYSYRMDIADSLNFVTAYLGWTP